MDSKKDFDPTADRCICRGEIVPEGRMVCWKCEHDIMEGKPMDETNIELKLNDHDHEIGSLKTA